LFDGRKGGIHGWFSGEEVVLMVVDGRRGGIHGWLKWKRRY
jgi:hypothetical protein